jgi:hypothetical protein
MTEHRSLVIPRSHASCLCAPCLPPSSLPTLRLSHGRPTVSVGLSLTALRSAGERGGGGPGIQPRVKSLRSSYTELYPEILHGVVSGHPTRGCIWSSYTGLYSVVLHGRVSGHPIWGCIRSSYTGLYPVILHAGVSGHATRGIRSSYTGLHPVILYGIVSPGGGRAGMDQDGGWEGGHAD